MPAFTSGPAPSPVVVNTAYYHHFTASGTSPIGFAIVGGMFPGVRLDSATGVLSGTPWATGTWVFFVQAKNTCGISVVTVVVDVLP